MKQAFSEALIPRSNNPFYFPSPTSTDTVLTQTPPPRKHASSDPLPHITITWAGCRVHWPKRKKMCKTMYILYPNFYTYWNFPHILFEHFSTFSLFPLLIFYFYVAHAVFSNFFNYYVNFCMFYPSLFTIETIFPTFLPSYSYLY